MLTTHAVAGEAGVELAVELHPACGSGPRRGGSARGRCRPARLARRRPRTASAGRVAGCQSPAANRSSASASSSGVTTVVSAPSEPKATPEHRRARRRGGAQRRPARCRHRRSRRRARMSAASPGGSDLWLRAGRRPARGRAACAAAHSRRRAKRPPDIPRRVDADADDAAHASAALPLAPELLTGERELVDLVRAVGEAQRAQTRPTSPPAGSRRRPRRRRGPESPGRRSSGRCSAPRT